MNLFGHICLDNKLEKYRQWQSDMKITWPIPVNSLTIVLHSYLTIIWKAFPATTSFCCSLSLWVFGAMRVSIGSKLTPRYSYLRFVSARIFNNNIFRKFGWRNDQGCRKLVSVVYRILDNHGWLDNLDPNQLV